MIAALTPTCRKFAMFAAVMLCHLASTNVLAQYTKLLDLGTIANGYFPYAAPVYDGTFLYGTTGEGGANGYGVIYKVKLDGTGFTKLLDFDYTTTGNNPVGTLYFDGTYLYGTTSGGGPVGYGTIFKIKTDGTGYTDVHDFTYSAEGAYPRGGVMSDGTFLYGMTNIGGPSSYGTVYKVKKDGTNFSIILSFDGTTNGAQPYGSLFSDGTFLYGLTSGGFSFNGSMFKIMPDGTGFQLLHTFSGGSNGANPYGEVISDGTFLYGMAQNGGASSRGMIFKIKSDGSGFASVIDFNNATGAFPKGSLVSDGTFLYGTTCDFGANARGTIFKIKTDGTGYLKLIDNDIGTSNNNPEGTFTLIGSTLYGVKSGKGAGAAPFLPGTLIKINTDGSGYTKVLSFEQEGYNPSGTLYFDGTYHYGLTQRGGLYDYGTIFRVKPDGSGYKRLYDFDGTTGNRPMGSLASDGTYFYGTTSAGGVNDAGVVFRVLKDGTAYTTLLNFDGTTNGASPTGSLTLIGSILYGMTGGGGANSYGTVFKINANGTGGYATLLDFDYTNNGGYPDGDLFTDGTFLYGTTRQGGATSDGTIFKIKSDGTGFAKLLDFDFSTSGNSPKGKLTSLDGTYLFGMTSAGGPANNGTIFKIKPDGSGFSTVYDFSDPYNGTGPNGSLLANGGYYYGMTTSGGFNSEGVVFRIASDGSGFEKMFDFNDGMYPYGSLNLDGTGNFIYGMTYNGGTANDGIVFKMSSTPFVTISDFAPAQGVPGTYVLISGIAFDPIAANNVVKFNNVTATIVTASTQALLVIVPTGATTGPISVTAGTTDITLSDFTIATKVVMGNGVVQTCGVSFVEGSGTDNLVETFMPVNAGDKVNVSFSEFDVGDVLNVYDGPSTSSPLIASLTGFATPPDMTATGAGGELTFEYVWQDASSTWTADITCVQGNGSVSITDQPLSTVVGGKITLDLVPLITTSNNNLDLASLQVISQPSSGATASISAAGVLTIDYNGESFSGQDQITIRACDTNGNCASRVFTINVSEATDIVVFNAVSPHGANPTFVIQNIEVLTDTKKNTVYIFDRWENEVWHGSDYDNNAVVFSGVSSDGADLPTGVYFYRIEFASGRKKITGFISLRR